MYSNKLRAIGLFVLLVFCLTCCTKADPTTSLPGMQGVGCESTNQCTPTQSWWNTAMPLQTGSPIYNGSSFFGLSAMACTDDATLTPTGFLSFGTKNSSGQVIYNVATVGLASPYTVTGPVTFSTTGSTSGHDLPSCIPFGNGYVGMYTHGESGDAACLGADGGHGSSQQCPDISVGNMITAGCNGTANVDICNPASMHPLPIGGASGGPLSEAYGVVENYYGNNYCMVGGQEQWNSSFAGGLTGNYVYFVLQCNMPNSLIADTGKPGGSYTTYDVLHGNTTTIQSSDQAMQMIAFAGHDDNLYSVDISGDSCSGSCASGAIQLVLPAIGSFPGCTISSSSFTHGSSATADVATLVNNFNSTGSSAWIGSGCSGYQNYYDAQVIKSGNRVGRGCAAAEINTSSGVYQCFDVVLDAGNVMALATGTAPTIKSPLTGSGLVNNVWNAVNHTSYQFCRGPVGIQHTIVVYCLNNWTAGGFNPGSLQGAQSGGPNYTIYRSLGRGVPVPGAGCNITPGSQKFCWCDWWFSKCSLNTGVDPTTYGTTGGSANVLGVSDGGGCTVGTWPTCLGGTPIVCTHNTTTCDYRSSFFVPNPVAANDISTRPPFEYSFAESRIATTATAPCNSTYDPATQGTDITSDSAGNGYFVFESCDTSTTSPNMHWDIYLAVLSPQCCATSYVAKVADLGVTSASGQGSLLGVQPMITSTDNGHIHIWIADMYGPGMGCASTGLCVREFSPNSYPVTNSTTFSSTTIYNPGLSGGNAIFAPCERNKRDEPNGQQIFIGCIMNSSGNGPVVVGSLVDNS